MERQIAITVTTNQPNPVPNWRLLNTQVQRVLCVCSEVFRYVCRVHAACISVQRLGAGFFLAGVRELMACIEAL